MEWTPELLIALAGVASGVLIGLGTIIGTSRVTTNRIEADQAMQTERIEHERFQAEQDRRQADRTRLDERKAEAADVYVKVGTVLTDSKPENIEAQFATIENGDERGWENIRAASRDFADVLADIERLQFYGWTRYGHRTTGRTPRCRH